MSQKRKSVLQFSSSIARRFKSLSFSSMESGSKDGFVTMTPEEFEQLQKYAEYSTRKLKDVLEKFDGNGELSEYNKDKPIDFKGFQKFMECYLDTDLPQDFCISIFHSFQKNSNNTKARETILERLQAMLFVCPSPEDDWQGARFVCLLPVLTPLVDGKVHSNHYPDLNDGVYLKDIVCHLSLIEGGKPEDKLKFVFKLYDTDDNGSLDSKEMDRIVHQMMHVAEYSGWDVTELRPILQEMLQKIDYDGDGVVTLAEWIQGGLTTIPLLVLLGLETNIRDDGTHSWRLKHFGRPAYCNYCSQVLKGVGSKGLSCTFCKYVAHERCVKEVPADCIHTYVKTAKDLTEEKQHSWMTGNNIGPCDKCNKPIKCQQGLVGKHCRWCQMTVHDKCLQSISTVCNLGKMRPHILPPWTIRPGLLNEQNNKSRNNSSTEVINSSGVGEAIKPESRINSISWDGQKLQITPLPETQPLLVFINPKSGGKQGVRLLRKMQSLLNPRQVYDLTNGGPMPGLNFFHDVENFRVLCCGGDGTVGWVLDSIDKSQLPRHPPVAILPLGTGNDLARCMRWGGGFEGSNIVKFLQQIEKSRSILMDRWSLNVTSDLSNSSEKGDPVPLSIINNYFSIGVDASICRKFHVMREKHPEKFNSRMKNKLWYSAFGTTETFAASCKKLYENLAVTVDGKELESWNKGHFQGIAILNIPSVYGGTNLWGNSKKPKKKISESSKLSNIKYAVQELGDKKLEIVGVEGAMEVGQIITGLRTGKRLAQGSDIVITTKKTFPMQVDGEPWMQVPCEIHIKHKNQVPMLMAPASGQTSFFSRLRRSSLVNGEM